MGHPGVEGWVGRRLELQSINDDERLCGSTGISICESVQCINTNKYVCVCVLNARKRKLLLSSDCKTVDYLKRRSKKITKRSEDKRRPG